MKTTRIHTVNGKIEAESIKMLLESHGVKTTIKSGSPSHGAFMGQYGAATAPFDWFDIYATEDSANAAKKILEDFGPKATEAEAPGSEKITKKKKPIVSVSGLVIFLLMIVFPILISVTRRMVGLSVKNTTSIITISASLGLLLLIGVIIKGAFGGSKS